MPTKIKRALAVVLRYPDGRLRGLALSRAHWVWLQFQPGERVIVETSRDDVVTGEVVIDGGERIIRAPMGESDLEHQLFVRRPLR